MHSDGYWLFKNLFTMQQGTQNQEDEEIGVEFLKLIKIAPEYNIKNFEQIVSSSWDKRINPVISKIILDLVLDKVSKIENKIKHKKDMDTDYNFVNDLETLVPNPYSHSPLLGNDTYRISSLREKITKIMDTLEKEDSGFDKLGSNGFCNTKFNGNENSFDMDDPLSPFDEEF